MRTRVHGSVARLCLCSSRVCLHLESETELLTVTRDMADAKTRALRELQERFDQEHQQWLEKVTHMGHEQRCGRAIWDAHVMMSCDTIRTHVAYVCEHAHTCCL